jgi:RNA polymerase sigma-70 factor, ECF subfamily
VDALLTEDLTGWLARSVVAERAGGARPRVAASRKPGRATTIAPVSSAATSPQSLDGFLASVERRAFRRAQFATRDRDEALDLVQDAMMQLARRYGMRPAAEWPALFQRILTNRIRDWQRRQTLRRRLFFWRAETSIDDDAADPLESVADAAQSDVAEALHQAELMRQLAGALERLPTRQREAFELRVWEGLSVEQSAQVMGCSQGSVKTHLSRALASLRGALEGVRT